MKDEAHGKACVVPSWGQPQSRGTWWSRFSFTRCCYKWQWHKKLNSEACQNISTFQRPITGAAPLYPHLSPFSSGLSRTTLCFHSLPRVMFKTMRTCSGPLRSPSSSCQSVNRGVPERQVVHVARCLNVLDPRQAQQWHTTCHCTAARL